MRLKSALALVRGAWTGVFGLGLLGMALFLFGASQADAAGTLSGTVRNASNAPIGAIEVTVYDAVFGTLRASTVTAGDGTFGTALPSGNYRMLFHDPTGTYVDRFSGGPTGTTTWAGSGVVFVADPGGGTQNAALIANARVTGIVTKPGGAAANGIVVEARTPAGTLVKTTTTDGAGAFTVTGLAPGTYTVHYADPAGVLAGTYHPGVNLVGAATPFTIGVGETATANIALVTGGGLSGVVRIGSGSQPAVGITALAIDTTTVELVGSAVTDAAGSYTIRGLAPGSYKVAWLDPVLFTDPVHSLRPVVAPAIDLAAVGTPTAHATGATYAVTASTFAPVPTGQLRGWGCDPTVFFPGADRNHSNLTGADLRGCALTNVNLTGSTFTGANLTQARINGTNLGFAIGLTASQLSSTQHDWAGTNLQWSSASLAGIDFAAGNYTLTSLNITGLNATGAIFNGRNLTSAVLSGANLTGAQLVSTNLTSAWGQFTNFTNANLGGANVWLANLGGATIVGADFRFAVGTQKPYLTATNHNWTGTKFRGVDLSYIDFVAGNYTLIGGSFEGSSFVWANLAGLNLTGADLSSASVGLANLTGTNLTNAVLDSASVNGAAFTGAIITGARMGANGLTRAQALSTNHNWAGTSFISGASGGLFTFDFTNIDFVAGGFNLTGSSLRVNLSGSNFAGLTLANVTFNYLSNAANLSGTNLTGTVFSGCTLGNASFGSANLTGATIGASTTMSSTLFTGANVAGLTITGANLSGVQNLTTAQLTTTNRNWTGTRLPYYTPLSGFDFSSGGYDLTNTSFESLNLSNAVFDGLALNGTNFTKARLDGADFEHTTLTNVTFREATGVNLKMSDATVTGTSFVYTQVPGINLANTVFTTSNLYGAVLGGAWAPNVNLSGNAVAFVSFRYANLTGANLTNANLYGAYLENAWVTGATFTNAAIGAARFGPTYGLTLTQLLSTPPDWSYAYFTGIDLRGIDFAGLGINIQGTRFVNSDLSGANLGGRNLTSSRFGGSNLTNATFTGATGTPSGGSTAIYSATTCPDGVVAPTGALTCVGHGFTN